MDSKLITYHIGEAARMLGLSPRSIRYYEELGLIKPSRTEGGFRLYSEYDIGVIRMILRFKDLGLALEEIRSLVGQRDGAVDADRIKTLREALLLRKAEFEAKIEKYREGIDQIDTVLNQLVRCRSCGQVMEREHCHDCIGERGKELAPLLDPLL